MKRFRIYGTLKDQFVGHIQSENLKDNTPQEALELAKEALGKRGIEAVKAIGVPKDKKDIGEIKNLGIETNFLYSEDCDFGSELIAGMPSIIIYDQSRDEDYMALVTWK